VEGGGVGGGGGGPGASTAGAGAGGGAGGNGGEEAAADPLLQQEFDALLRRPALLGTLALAECAALQNNLSDSLALYRAGPSIDLTKRLLTAGAHPTHPYESAAAVLSAGLGGLRGGGGGGGGGAGAGGGEGEEEEEGSRPASASSALRADEEGGHAHPSTPKMRGAAASGEEGGAVAEGLPPAAAAGGGVGGGGAPAPSPSAAAAVAPALNAAQQAAAASAAAYAAAAALTPTPPGVSLLWTYFCPLLRGYSVSCMAWCEAPGTKDLLAVGYGPTDFGATPETGSRGLVCLWTLANPTQPAAVLRTPENVGVSSLAFSAVAPRLLAVGCYDGGLAVYDAGDALASSQALPAPPVALSERLAPGSHSEPVWGLQWVPRPESAGGQVLVSVSTDGRVTEWTTKKNTLLPRQLLKLRRGGAGGAAAVAGGGTGGLLARSAPGLSLEFVFEPPPPVGEGVLPPLPRDGHPTPFYWVGTEEGTLARCSTLYSEQYMDTVAAHIGPINKVRLSPFSHAAILTASADWSVKLWNANALSGAGAGAAPPCLCFNTDDSRDVADVAWSPTISTRFASVTRDGHVQVRPAPNNHIPPPPPPRAPLAMVPLLSRTTHPSPHTHARACPRIYISRCGTRRPPPSRLSSTLPSTWSCQSGRRCWRAR
jgi:WD40 repeat protein